MIGRHTILGVAAIATAFTALLALAPAQDGFDWESDPRLMPAEFPIVHVHRRNWTQPQPSTLEQSREYGRQLAKDAAESIEARLSKDIAAVLDDFHDAASKADYKRYFSHWTDQSVFLGTDATERWVGQEFRDYAKKRFDTGTGWTYHPRDRHITLSPDGNHAFFDELLDHARYSTCRGSGVLVRKDGSGPDTVHKDGSVHGPKSEWLILQYNLSIPIPNELAEGIVATIKKGAPKAPQEEKHKE